MAPGIFRDVTLQVRTPRPGLLDFKKVIGPLRIEVARDWSGLRVQNLQDFADTSAYGFRYEVTDDTARWRARPLTFRRWRLVPL